MPAPIHPEVKKVIIRLVNVLHPRELAYWLGWNPETVYRICRQYQKTGSVENKARTGRPHSLPWEVILYIVRRTQMTPDIYLSELQELVWHKFNILTSLPTIHRIQRKQGLYLKQLSKTAIERNERKRARYYQEISGFSADKLCFADESAMEARMTFRKYGRGERGERVRKRANFVRGHRGVPFIIVSNPPDNIFRYSILPVISIFGVFHVKVVKGSVTGDIFVEFVEEVLKKMNPYPLPKSVLVIDNAAIHRNEVLEEMAQERGVKLVYLPAYSPDFNPIEEGFSAMKAWVRRYGRAVRKVLALKNPNQAVHMLTRAVHTAMCWPKTAGWYAHSGYCTKEDFATMESDIF